MPPNQQLEWFLLVFLKSRWTFPSVFNFTIPAYISFCLNRFGVQTWVNRRDYSILRARSIMLRAEQTTLGSNPADEGVFLTLLVSSLKSSNLAVSAGRHSSKEKGIKHTMRSILDGRTLFLHCVHNKCS